MKSLKRGVLVLLISISLSVPRPARADMFGGDIAVLVQILAQAIQQLYQLKQIVSKGAETIQLMKELNKGISQGLAIIHIINPKFNPGMYGNLQTAEQALAAINDLYGAIPQSSESRLQEAQDRSVAESISMNGTLFRYADQVDDESKRILDHSKTVSPQGAGKLTAESIAILIGVSTQVLRTNSMMLKMMAENMALQNRKEKLATSQFKTQYGGISSALGTPFKTELPSLQE